MSRSDTLLFRWIGRDIEGSHLAGSHSKLPSLSDGHRDKYIQYLDDALSEGRGLYAKIPEGDFLGSGHCLRLSRPCICFTELRLGESSSHWRKYGRMALAFSKPTVVNWGGGPVAYMGGSAKDPAVRRLELLHKRLRSNLGDGTDAARVYDAFEYLQHFFKRMRYARPQLSVGDDRPQPKGSSFEQPQAISRPKTSENRRKYKANAARLPQWKALPYLDEHEWRLVFSRDQPRWRSIKIRGVSDTAWFPIQPGRELVAVVLPDNLTMTRALQSERIMRKLIGKGRPPVQILSMETVIRL